MTHQLLRYEVKRVNIIEQVTRIRTARSLIRQSLAHASNDEERWDIHLFYFELNSIYLNSSILVS